MCVIFGLVPMSCREPKKKWMTWISMLSEFLLLLKRKQLFKNIVDLLCSSFLAHT